MHEVVFCFSFPLCLLVYPEPLGLPHVLLWLEALGKKEDEK